MSQRGHRVLIVGCGEIGSRHLQAVASLPQVSEIEVADPRPEALELGRERLQGIPGRPPSTVVRWLGSLEEATPRGALCIIATQAQGRCQRVRETAEFLGYASFLLEKIVAQSIEEGENLLEFSKRKNLAVWVNCKDRAYPVHRRLKSLLDPGDPIIFNVAGGNHGLATNGIHMADLFAYYDGAKRVESAGSHIDPVIHPSKRATHIFDLSGTLQGITERGSRFTLTYAEDHQGPEIIVITTRRRRCLVDHFSRWAIESDEATGWSWRAVPFEGNILISQTSQVFVSDILNSGQCHLPTLEESLVAHRFILRELQPYFRQLLRREDALCPVT